MANTEHNYIDLAIVKSRNTNSYHVVQCPAWKATIGGIVEFQETLLNVMSLGEILMKITVEENSEQWKFINEVTEITKCARVWAHVGGDDDRN